MRVRPALSVFILLLALAPWSQDANAKKNRVRPADNQNLHEQIAQLRAQVAQLASQVNFANRRLYRLQFPLPVPVRLGDDRPQVPLGDGRMVQKTTRAVKQRQGSARCERDRGSSGERYTRRGRSPECGPY